MAQDWNSIVKEVLAEFSDDWNEQEYLRAKLKRTNSDYHLAFSGLMSGFSEAKTKDLLRRALRDMTEER